METKICGVTFKRVNDHMISVYSSDGRFHKNIDYPASTQEELVNSANYYYVHCY